MGVFLGSPQIHTASHFLPTAAVLVSPNPLSPRALPLPTCPPALTHLPGTGSEIAQLHLHSFAGIILTHFLAPRARPAEVVPTLSPAPQHGGATMCHQASPDGMGWSQRHDAVAGNLKWCEQGFAGRRREVLPGQRNFRCKGPQVRDPGRQGRGSRASGAPTPLPHFTPEQLRLHRSRVFLLGSEVLLGQRNMCLRKGLGTIAVGAGEPKKGLELRTVRARFGD